MIGKPVLMAWWKCTSRKGTTYPTHPHSVLAENFALHHRAQARRESEPYISRSMSRQQTSVGSPRFIDPLQLHPIQHEIGTITFASSRFVSSRTRGWWLTEWVLLYFFCRPFFLCWWRSPWSLRCRPPHNATAHSVRWNQYSNRIRFWQNIGFL